MDEEELIKQKMKETKKQMKEENSGSVIGIFCGIILSIIQAISSFMIPKDTQWFSAILISYMVVITYIVVIIQSNLPVLKDKTKEKMVGTYISANPLMFIAVCFYRQMGFWSIVIGIIYFFIMGMCWNSEGLDKTYRELDKLEDLSQKAVFMESKKVRIIATILALIGGALAIFFGIRLTYNTDLESPMMYLVFTEIFFIGIWDLIVYIILKSISKRKEKILNATFNLRMGEMIENHTYDKIFNTHILYNLNIEYYKIISIFITFIGLLVSLKFNICNVSLITMIYLIVNTAVTLDKGHIHIDPPEKIASIYNSTGSKTGEIRYH